MGNIRYDKALDDEILALWRKINENLPPERQITKVQASRIYSKLKCRPHTLIISMDSSKKRTNNLRDIIAQEMPPPKDGKKRLIFADILHSNYRV